MRVLVQRVSRACVRVEGRERGRIDKGLLLLVGISATDTAQEVQKMARKIVHLRIFSDEAGKFSHTVLDVAGGVLVVSQFTLYANTRKGRRPSFTEAARPEQAEPLIHEFINALGQAGISRLESGVFGAGMDVELCNQGPVTIWLDSKDRPG